MKSWWDGTIVNIFKSWFACYKLTEFLNYNLKKTHTRVGVGICDCYIYDSWAVYQIWESIVYCGTWTKALHLTEIFFSKDFFKTKALINGLQYRPIYSAFHYDLIMGSRWHYIIDDYTLWVSHFRCLIFCTLLRTVQLWT